MFKKKDILIFYLFYLRKSTYKYIFDIVQNFSNEKCKFKKLQKSNLLGYVLLEEDNLGDVYC